VFFSRMTHRVSAILNQIVPNPTAAMSHGGKTTISSHCLDTSRGVPAAGLALSLEKRDEAGMFTTFCGKTTHFAGHWQVLHRASTNDDGRVAANSWEPLPGPGHYCVRFYTKNYFEKNGIKDYLYTEIPVEFDIREEGLGKHYHIPLLLSPFGYSTYRGS
jgi:5-hydroxyisourate hydrolase